MKTTVKTPIILLATLIFQSCNMSKHYANMRIDHTNTETNIRQTSSNQSEKIPVLETASVPVSKNDSTFHISTFTSDSLPNIKPSFKEEPVKTKHNTFSKKINLNPLKIHSPLAKKNVVKKHKNSRGKRKLLPSATKWIDVDETKNQILICLGVAALIVIILYFAGVGSIGQIILWGLAILAVIIAAALAFGLLILGFLRMCGLDW